MLLNSFCKDAPKVFPQSSQGLLRGFSEIPRGSLLDLFKSRQDSCVMLCGHFQDCRDSWENSNNGETVLVVRPVASGLEPTGSTTKLSPNCFLSPPQSCKYPHNLDRRTFAGLLASLCGSYGVLAAFLARIHFHLKTISAAKIC